MLKKSFIILFIILCITVGVTSAAVDKLTMMEDASYELNIGDSWNLGNGYLLTLHDFGVDGIFAYFRLTKDMDVLSEMIAGEDDTIYYRENIEGESRIIIATHIRDIHSTYVELDSTYRHNYVFTEQITLHSDPSDAILIIDDAKILDQNGLSVQFRSIPNYTMMYKDFENYVEVDIATPPLKTPVTIENLPLGTYMYRLDKVGYDQFSGTFEIDPYLKNDVKVSMKPLDILITVDEKELVVGESIELANGYKLILSSVDTSDSTILLTLIQNGFIIDNQKIKLYDSYTYENYIFSNVKDVFKTVIDGHVVGVAKLGPVIQYSTIPITDDESESTSLMLNETEQVNQNTEPMEDPEMDSSKIDTTSESDQSLGAEINDMPENGPSPSNSPVEETSSSLITQTHGLITILSAVSILFFLIIVSKKLWGINKRNVPRLVISKFRGKTLMGDIVLNRGENLIGREDIVYATNNMLDNSEYSYVSRKAKGGHVKIVSKPKSKSFSIEHISQRGGVTTTVNGNSIEGMGKQPLKDGDIIILNGVFEFIFKVN